MSRFNFRIVLKVHTKRHPHNSDSFALKTKNFKSRKDIYKEIGVNCYKDTFQSPNSSINENYYPTNMTKGHNIKTFR